MSQLTLVLLWTEFYQLDIDVSHHTWHRRLVVAFGADTCTKHGRYLCECIEPCVR